MNAGETALLAEIGMKPARVLTRWPLTLALAPRAYLPGLLSSGIAAALSLRAGLPSAALAALVSGLALSISLVAHEVGHLLASRHARGVTPRMLLMRATGGVSILEGRFEDARGAAFFAAGGPLASLAATVALIAGAFAVPQTAVVTALLVAGGLNVCLLVVNLLPLAPMDGYLLFRAALWSSLDDRAAAERRAIWWSRTLLVYCAVVAVLVGWHHRELGGMALFLVATFAFQHRLATRPRPGSTKR